MMVLSVFSLWKNTRTHQKPSCGSLGGSGVTGSSPLASARSNQGKTSVFPHSGAQPRLTVSPERGPAQAAPSWGQLSSSAAGSNWFCVTIPPSRGCLEIWGSLYGGEETPLPTAWSHILLRSQLCVSAGSWSGFGYICLRVGGS